MSFDLNAEGSGAYLTCTAAGGGAEQPADACACRRAVHRRCSAALISGGGEAPTGDTGVWLGGVSPQSR
ncbi:MAG: hypothetical protein LBQ91_02140 [Oscillospiraceae bacterium]|nr:hypothetical protein [Oscillospiraceae bacterium]